MIREIKFRAWDKKENRMRYLSMGSVHISMNDGHWAFWGGVDRICGSADESGILMQFTGLKDEGSKDIYFGDIVECENVLDKRMERFEVTHHELAPSMIFKGIGCDTHHHIIYVTMKEYRIIGNVHENPKLLKQ